MLSEIQSNSIKKCKKFAKKNKFCKWVATGLIVIMIVLGNILRHDRKHLIHILQLVTVCLVFLVNASFAPMTFQNNTTSENVSESETGIPNDKEVISENVVSSENQISLDDLIAQKEEIVTEANEVDQAVVVNTFHKDSWNLLLVNKQHPIPEDYTFTLGTIKGSMQCDERIITPLTDMFAAAKEDGINLIVCSPYRDITRQEYLFDRKMKNYLNTGYSYMDAYKTASITVTVPGASEHQVGLAVDIISDKYNALNEGFGETDAGIWLKEHSADYGFILRYPKGKEDITGIQYEPWHFRYVGKDAALIIMQQDIALEEFIDRL